MLMPRDIQNFLHSEAVGAIQDKFHSAETMDADDFYDMRDYIIWRLAQTNAQRPNAIAGITKRGMLLAMENQQGGVTVAVSSFFPQSKKKKKKITPF